jgi:hypothetical protein
MTKMAKHKKTSPDARVAPAPEATQTPKSMARGIRKKFLTTGPVCRVTLTLPKEAAYEAETVCVVGEFNNWSPDAAPMKRRTNGDFCITLDLEKGRSYRFRYLIDGCKFENDWRADRYQSNPYGSEDSVVEV